MAVTLAILVGVLVAAGVYLMLRRDVIEVLLGLAIASHATYLLLIAMGGAPSGAKPPILEAGPDGKPLPVIDPIPQALILTAIVIGFGVLAFLMVQVIRAYEESGRLEVAEGSGEEPAPKAKGGAH